MTEPARVISIDLDANRRAKAHDFGATHDVDPAAPDWKDQVLALTDGLGVDVAIEAVGIPATFGTCIQIVRPGGNVANVGVHGKPVELPLQDLWIHNINLSMGLVNTNTLAMLLNLVAEDKLPVDKLVTHRFTLDQMMEAYDTFSRAAETKAIKVAITRA